MRRARVPFRAWATRRYLPHHFPLPPSLFHRWLFLVLHGFHRRRGQRRNTLAPRGSAKTTITTNAYPLYTALEELEPFTVICSDTSGQSKDYVEWIREEIDTNPKLRADYPDALRGLKARQGKITFGNGCAVEAASTGSKIRGRKHGMNRPTLIILDDPQGKEHIISPLMRNRSWTWLMQDVMNAGTPETNVLVLGTSLHREGIVNRLQTQPGWTTRVFRSIIQWPERMDLWNGPWRDILFDWDDPAREEKARAFFEAHRAEMEA